jgi:hypothetical protein
MKNLLFVAFILSIFACKKSTPDCLTERVENFKKEATLSGATIDIYKFEGKELFLFNNGTFDTGTQVVDGNCNDLCLIGGKAALTTCDGKEFVKDAVFVKNIWKREKK